MKLVSYNILRKENKGVDNMLNNIMNIMNYYDLEGCYEMTMDTNG